MKAILFKRYGGPEVLSIEEIEKPVPGPGDVLIKVRAATVATADSEFRSFKFPAWLWLPMRLAFGVFRPRRHVLGQELAGEIEAVGENVTQFKAGDKVRAALSRFGAHAEFACLPESAAIASVPANASFEEAACLTAFALNALHFIRKAEIKAGDKVLINGAGGAIGTIAVQLAKHAGAEVTVTDKAGKLDVLRAIGADHAIDCMKEDFTKNGVTYDVILDGHGESPYQRSLNSLAANGRYVFANPRLYHMLRGAMRSKRAGKRVLFTLAGYKVEDLDYLGALMERGVLRPVIDRVFAFEDFRAAHAYVDTGERTGNVVLRM